MLREESVHLLDAQHYLMDISAIMTSDEKITSRSRKLTADAVALLRPGGLGKTRGFNRRVIRSSLGATWLDAAQKEQGSKLVRERNKESLQNNQTVQAVYAHQTAARLIADLQMFVTNLHHVGGLDDALEEVLINELDADLGILAKELGLDDKNAHEGIDPVESARQVLELNNLAAKHMARAQSHVEGMLRQQGGSV